MCDPVTLKGDEVMIYQDGDKIIVTELRPIKDAPELEWVIYFNKNSCPFEGLNIGLEIVTPSDECIQLDSLVGWLPMPIYQPESNSQDKAALYEKLRKLNPREFAELHERNLRGEDSFDELVSRLP